MAAYELIIKATSFGDLVEGTAEINARFQAGKDGLEGAPLAGLVTPSPARTRAGSRGRGLLDDVSAAAHTAAAGGPPAAEDTADGQAAGDLGSPADGGTGALGAGEEAGPQDPVATGRTRRARSTKAEGQTGPQAEGQGEATKGQAEAAAQAEAETPAEAQAETEAQGPAAEDGLPDGAEDHGGGRGGDPAPGSPDGAVAADSSAGMAAGGSPAPEQPSGGEAPAGGETAGAVTLEQVRAAAQQLMDKKGFPAATAACQAVGVPKINASLTPDQLVAVMAEIQKRL